MTNPQRPQIGARVRSERGEITSFLILLAGLGVAAMLASAILGQTVTGLANDVGNAGGAEQSQPSDTGSNGPDRPGADDDRPGPNDDGPSFEATEPWPGGEPRPIFVYDEPCDCLIETNMLSSGPGDNGGFIHPTFVRDEECDCFVSTQARPPAPPTGPTGPDDHGDDDRDTPPPDGPPANSGAPLWPGGERPLFVYDLDCDCLIETDYISSGPGDNGGIIHPTFVRDEECDCFVSAEASIDPDIDWDENAEG